MVTLGRSVTSLYGPWKFHIGDSPSGRIYSPSWASPNLNDSDWETVELSPRAKASVDGIPDSVPGWTDRGHAGYYGYAWYRIRLRIDAQPGTRFALEGPSVVDDAFQVFINGELVGSSGQFPIGSGKPTVYSSLPTFFPIPYVKPGADTSSSTVLILAVRVWLSPLTGTNIDNGRGGLRIAPIFGEEGAVKLIDNDQWRSRTNTVVFVSILSLILLLGAIVALAVAMLDKEDHSYRWLSAVFLLVSIYDLRFVLSFSTRLLSAPVDEALSESLIFPLMLAGWVMVWWSWFRLREPAWIPNFIAGLTVAYILTDAVSRDTFALLRHEYSAMFLPISIATRLMFLPLLLFVVLQGIRQEGREASLALPALLLNLGANFQNELAQLHVPVSIWVYGIYLTMDAASEIFVVIAMTLLMLRRLRISRQRQREVASDIRQAQEVQRVLLPEKVCVPGLIIESEYLPAREVGGDFFQILPNPSDGSTLIVAGDVTGKGLQAGMLVAVMVGAIRTAAEHTTDPKSVLASLNRRLVGRSDAFATCLALRIEAGINSEVVTLANAGHLAPYLNGIDVPMEGALPLGMLEDTDFPESTFHFACGDTLTLISDGILEAQDKRGELFGFDRVRQTLIATPGATSLADAARRFGQNDDITVVTITRSA